MIAAVILAAGASSRMGQPKAFLRIGDLTFAERVATSIRAAAIDDVMIAVSHVDHKILELCELHSMSAVINAATQTSVPLGSIQAAILEIINRPVDGLLVWPVDYPHVRSGTAAAVVSAFLRSEKAMVLPVHKGRRGHPVVFGRAVFDELLSADPEIGPRAVVRAGRERVLEVDVDDAAILEDIDTPEAYRDLVRRHELGRLPI